MAETLDDNTVTDPKHNQGAWQDTMNTGFAEIYDLEKQIKDMQEEYIKPLQKAKTKVSKKLRADLDASNADLKPHYLLFKRHHDVMEFEDESDTSKSIETLRKAHEAMAAGGQVDWLTALGDGGSAGMSA